MKSIVWTMIKMINGLVWLCTLEYNLNKPESGRNMKNLTYKILLRPEPEGGYTVLVPSLQGCITYGKTVEESIQMASEAISLYLEELQSRNEEIPEEINMLEYNLQITV